MDKERSRPSLNPVLRFRQEPVPKPPSGGGKGRASIVEPRFAQQQKRLQKQAQKLYVHRETFPAFAGKALVAVRMFQDSFAPSHTPDDLFAPEYGCRLVAPFRDGYLVEAATELLERLASAIQNPRTVAQQADISRVSSITALDEQDWLRGRSVGDLWEASLKHEGGRLFCLWLSPLHDTRARDELVSKFMELIESRTVVPVIPATMLLERTDGEALIPSPEHAWRYSSLERAMRAYRKDGVARVTVMVPDKASLSRVVSSGTSVRIDPIRPVRSTSPGTGPEPTRPLRLEGAPTVAVVDGGLHANSYRPAETWRASPLVRDSEANRIHGNQISSLCVHAHAWNNNRVLPALECRIGTAQAIPSDSSTVDVTGADVVGYIDKIAGQYPQTRVWNLSANQTGPSQSDDEVSLWGDDLRLVARKHRILIVVSIGNVGHSNSDRPSPPADCEAAIAVGGREADENGNLSQRPCSVCLPGPAPLGMLKPDLSWYSTLRVLGGVIVTGSSYAGPLVSSLAAHSFANLKDPSPDLVKALLINTAECDAHDPKLGWGTPYHGRMPWVCGPGSVTLAWRARLQPRLAYYWNDLPIPPELLRNGKLYGKVRLTAILNPLVSPHGGANYFASRLETSLQYIPKYGQDWKGLLEPIREDTIANDGQRQERLKWHPVRHHVADFSNGGGRQVAHGQFRLYARIYTRDFYQVGLQGVSENDDQEVAFVLTLLSGESRDSIYDSMVRGLGVFVESALTEQDIEHRVEI